MTSTLKADIVEASTTNGNVTLRGNGTGTVAIGDNTAITGTATVSSTLGVTGDTTLSGTSLMGTTSHYSQGERLAISYNYLSGTGIVVDSGTGGGAAMRYRTNSNLVGSIITSTTATAFNTSSDSRLKSNIENSASASDKIDAMQVRQFDWNIADSHQDYGLIAQELQLIEPLAVSGSADSDDMMGVDYSKLVPMLIKEIQELRGRVAALEAS